MSVVYDVRPDVMELSGDAASPVFEAVVGVSKREFGQSRVWVVEVHKLGREHQIFVAPSVGDWPIPWPLLQHAMKLAIQHLRGWSKESYR